MNNNFYNEFDNQRLHESQRDNDYRSNFQIDRDRIIYSSEFRRLQGKTQVFIPGEYDFYRTRLTHSIEVAQIGRSICNYLTKTNETFNDEFYIDPDLVEAACLTHDLGHPPFGHAGERTLHSLMKPVGGFEGNAQTLRLITEVFYRDDAHRRGMNPTRAFLDSILKYKSLYSSEDNLKNHFVYDYQKEFLDFAFDGIDLSQEYTPGDELNSFRSIECQIMDWADDTAYAINDLVDSISGGFITIEKLMKWQRIDEDKLSIKHHQYLDEMINWIKSGKYKKKFGSQIGEFIVSTQIKERKNILSGKTNRYKYELVVDKELQERANFYKEVSKNLVFWSSQLHQMEFKSNEMIKKVFGVLKRSYVEGDESVKLLPDFTGMIVKKEKDPDKKTRLICDYIAGMTDVYALRIYRRLFDPTYSSVVDLVSLKE